MMDRMKKMLLALMLGLALAPLIAAPAVWAVEPHEVLEDPALEARARELSTELRCLVCQNQSIDDSNAILARDLRVLVRERLLAGDTDDEVIAYLVDRYGEFVLLKPRFAGHTLLLWLAPIGVLLLAGGAMLYSLSRRKKAVANTLSSDEEARINALLDEKQDQDRL